MLERIPRGLGIRIVSGPQPEDAASMKDRRLVVAERPGELAPEAQRAQRKPRIDLVRTIAAADDPRFVA
jgi:hypothetical protein